MEARTVSSLPTAAPHHDVVRCLLAIATVALSFRSMAALSLKPYSVTVRRFRRLDDPNLELAFPER